MFGLYGENLTDFGSDEKKEEYLNIIDEMISEFRKKGDNVTMTRNIVNNLEPPQHSNSFPPNTYMVSIKMHSQLNNVFNDWLPEWIYSPFVSKKLYGDNLNIIKVNNGDVGTSTLTCSDLHGQPNKKFSELPYLFKE